MSPRLCTYFAIPSSKRPLLFMCSIITSSSHGFLYEYDKIYDRINTKNEKPLQIIDRIRYNPTTSDDPIIQEVTLHPLCFLLCSADYVLRLSSLLLKTRPKFSQLILFSRCSCALLDLSILGTLYSLEREISSSWISEKVDHLVSILEYGNLSRAC